MDFKKGSRVGILRLCRHGILGSFHYVFFPILIKVHLGGNEIQIGLAMGLSVLVAALLVPLIGAYSDASGKRMPILIIAACMTAVLTVLAGYSGLMFALVLGFLANITHMISKDIYDAKMIDVVPPSLYGALSGFGVSIGYCGTIASLAVGYVLLSHLGWESLRGVQALFWEAAVFYLLFSLPLFFMVPDKMPQVLITPSLAIAGAIREVRRTISHMSEISGFGQFLVASFFYNNGMNTVIIFLSLYAREVIGLGVQEFFPVFALMALGAAGGSFYAGRLSDIHGPAPIIRKVLLVWIAIVLVLILSPSYRIFLGVGIIGGAMLGAIWTLNRHMVAKLAPAHKIAELFGFEGLTEKFSGALGPIIFGFLAFYVSYPAALISVLIFLGLGLILMYRIRTYF